MNTSTRIKERRKELHMSGNYVASRLKISRATFYRYENEEIKKIPADTLREIAAVLNTSVDYLMGDTINPAPTQNLLRKASLRKLLDAAQDCTPSQLDEVIDFINWLKHKEET